MYNDDKFFAYVCPKCKKIVEDPCSAYSDWTCEHCGHETNDDNLIYAIDKKKYEAELDRLKKLAKRFELV